MRDIRPPASILSVLALFLGGCGSVSSGDLDAGNNGDPTPPEVVSISPAHEATQVMDEPVVIEFSKPMDQSTVAEAFPGATLVWNSAGTQVEITIDYPFAATAVPFTVALPVTVTDLDGNGLAQAFSITFVLAALVAVTVEFEPALSGNRPPGCSSGTFIMAGDTETDHDTCPGVVRFGAVSFSMADLPDHEDILAVRSAFVRSQVISVDGNPNDPALGAYVVDHIVIEARGDMIDPTFKSQAALMLFQPGDIVVGEPVELEVTPLVAASWADGDASFQLRFSPAEQTNNDAVRDSLFLRRTAEENPGIVADGVTEPDEANRMRLEIEYFQ